MIDTWYCTCTSIRIQMRLTKRCLQKRRNEKENVASRAAWKWQHRLRVSRGMVNTAYNASHVRVRGSEISLHARVRVDEAEGPEGWLSLCTTPRPREEEQTLWSGYCPLFPTH